MLSLYVVLSFLYERPDVQLGLLPQGPHGPYNLNHADLNVALGSATPAQEAVPDPLDHNPLPPDEAARECLRRLAIRLLGSPDSQTDMFRMEPSAAGGVRVLISFETAPGNVLFLN
jgi:hypothetical protein